MTACYRYTLKGGPCAIPARRELDVPIGGKSHWHPVCPLHERHIRDQYWLVGPLHTRPLPEALHGR